MVTGQNDTVVTTKGGTWMVVMMVAVTPLPEEYTALSYGGQDIVIGVGRTNGGKCIVQGAQQPTVGAGWTQTLGSTKKSPDPPPPPPPPPELCWTQAPGGQ